MEEREIPCHSEKEENEEIEFEGKQMGRKYSGPRGLIKISRVIRRARQVLAESFPGRSGGRRWR